MSLDEKTDDIVDIISANKICRKTSKAQQPLKNLVINVHFSRSRLSS